MAEEVVRVLRIEVGDSQRTVKALRKEASELRDSLLNLDKGSEDYAKTVAALLNIENELGSVMKATKTTTEAADGSYAQLQQRMKELRAEWRATGDDARRADLGKQIDEINTQLKEFDKTIGDNFRNVGNYSEGVKDAFRDIRNEIKQYRGDLLTLEEGTDEYNATLQKLADAQFKLRDMNEIAAMSANDLGEKLNTVNRLAAGVASGFGAYRGIMALVGADTEKTDKAMVKLQATIAFVQGVQGLEGLNKTLLAARLQFKGLLSFIPKVIAGLRGVSAAVAATGIGALAVAVGLLIGYWDEISKMWEGTPTTLNKVQNSIDAVNDSLEQSGTSTKLSEAGLDAYIQKLKDGAKASDAMAAAERAMTAERHTQLKIQQIDLQEAYDTAIKKAQKYQDQIDDVNYKGYKAFSRIKRDKWLKAADDASIAMKRITVELSETSAEAVESIQEVATETTKAADNGRDKLKEIKAEIESLLGKDSVFDPDKAREKVQEWYDLGYITAEQYARGMKDYGKNDNVLSKIFGFDTDDVLKGLDEHQQEIASRLEFDPKMLDGAKKFGEAYTDITKLWTEQDIEYREKMFDYAQVISANMANILGKETATGKAFAIANSTINTIEAALGVLRDTRGPLIIRAAAMAATLTTGAAQIANIAKVNPHNPQSSGTGGGALVSPPRFVADGVTYTRNVQTDSELEQARQTPVVKAYVVEGELTEAQRKALAKKKNATF